MDISFGVIRFLGENVHRWWRWLNKQSALSFDGINFKEENIWHKNTHGIRRVCLIGVNNSDGEPVTAKVVVQQVGVSQSPDQPERPLQVFGAPRGTFSAEVPPRKSARAWFEFVDVVEPPGEMACLCYAKPVNECYVGRQNVIELRCEGGLSVESAKFSITTHLEGGVKVPLTVERLT